MTRSRFSACAAILLSCALTVCAQEPTPTANSVVPTLVRFSGTLTDPSGKPMTGVVGVTFYLYKDAQTETPLWMEAQNVRPDASGRYSVQLGSTKPNGLPTDVFASGEARWLGVQVEGQSALPRVLLLSVPYALKAGDAETIGGLPPSAFMLAVPSPTGASASSGPSAGTAANAPPPSGAVTGTGTLNFLPKWDSTSDIVSSVIFQSGTGSTAKIGINTTSPAATLDVSGAGTIRGALTLPATGTATATAGKNSQPLNMSASVFNSGTGTAVSQNFRWQTEPVSNDTSSASGSLNLLYGSGSNTLTETGLNIASDGQITFAPGQTFPNTGNGTVTSVGSGAGLAGGPITSSGTLSIATGGVTNAMLQNSSVTVSAGTDLLSSGSVPVPLGGSVTLSLDTTKVPQLGSPNNFTANQNVTGSITATGNIGGGGQVSGTAGNFQGTSANEIISVSNNNGTGDGIFAFTSGQYGVFGESVSTTDFSAGVAGESFAGSGKTLGVSGTNLNGEGAGVYGVENGQSSTGAGFIGGAGVWGDGGNNGHNGVLATADSAYAVVAVNNSTNLASVSVGNNTLTPGAPAFQAYGNFGTCTISVNGNLTCTGSKSAVVPVDGGSRKVALYAVESPENWFEDVGSGQLSNGSAVMTLEPTFAQTVNADAEYHVFITPKADCEGVYVSNETATGFEVHELRGGHSNIAFDYRIMAHRKGYESVRLADMTDSFKSATTVDNARPK